jgi:hypothetical protein
MKNAIDTILFLLAIPLLIKAFEANNNVYITVLAFVFAIWFCMTIDTSLLKQLFRKVE